MFEIFAYSEIQEITATRTAVNILYIENSQQQKRHGCWRANANENENENQKTTTEKKHTHRPERKREYKL